MLKRKEAARTKSLAEQILNEAPRLAENDCFTFRCGHHLSCYNRCCANVNIVLTPFDILRLKNNLGISSGEFLQRYSVIPFTQKQTFPLVLLQMQEGEQKTCPFVGEEGCTVYEDRPWACRMYPIGVASPGNQEDAGFFFLINEEFCEGHRQENSWTIGQWIQDQGVEEYDKLGEEFKAITLHEVFLREDTGLEPAQMDMLFMSLYDLDKFRSFVFKSTFLKKFRLDRRLVEGARNNDLDLLRIGFRWIRFCIFGEATFEIRDRVKKESLHSMPSRGSRLR